MELAECIKVLNASNDLLKRLREIPAQERAIIRDKTLAIINMTQSIIISKVGASYCTVIKKLNPQMKTERVEKEVLRYINNIEYKPLEI